MDSSKHAEQSLFSFLVEQKKRRANVDVTIYGGFCQGGMQIRDGDIVAAHAGSLQGNGAVMTLGLMSGVSIQTTPNNSSANKTVTILTEGLIKFLQSSNGTKVSNILGREDRLLDEAKSLFFQYQYNEAGKKIVKILQANRYHYIAWLWRSRLLNSPSEIEKALDEAHRWGNHDHEILNEIKKIRPQLESNRKGSFQRCFFCWSILSNNSRCSYCHAHQSISSNADLSSPKAREIKYALKSFEQAFNVNPKSAPAAYLIGLAYFNLQQMQKASHFVGTAVRLSPQTVVFQKGLDRLRDYSPRSAEKRSVAPADESALNLAPPAQEPVAKKVAKASSVKAAASAPLKEPVEKKGKTISGGEEKKDQKSIFVIEDSPTSRKVLSMILGRNNFKVIEAATGKEAIALANDIKPSLILLDVMLPDMTGYDILPKLRAMPYYQELPVIMLTGKKGSADRAKGLMLGTNEYLTKPFNPEKLISVIKNHI